MTTPPPAILIRTPNWLGDLMMSTAFVQAVLEAYPDSRVDLVVKAGLHQLPLPHRGKILPFDKKKQSSWAFGRSLKGPPAYDLFFVLPPSFSSALMAFAAGARRRIGHPGQGRGLFLNQAIPYRIPHRQQHLIQEYLELLGERRPPGEHYPHLALTPDWAKAQLDQAFAPVPPGAVALTPGALYGPAKQWPLEHYAALAQALTAQGRPVWILGMAGDFPATLTPPGVVNLCGQTNLLQLVALLSQMSLLVSNDSGTMHLGAALGLPQIALFGSTSTTWTGPVNPKAQVLSLRLDCSPCFKRDCPLGHRNCLQLLSPSQVLQQIASLLPPLAQD